MSLHACTTAVVERANRIRIRIDAGQALNVDVASDVSDSELHTSLFGLALGVLAHQRGTPLLHASALQIDGRAVVLAGHGGTGKSTTARALVHRGHRLLADDQVVIDPELLLIHPSFPAMRLWASSATALGEVIDPDLPVLPAIDKYHIPSADVFQTEPGRLGSILVLTKDASLKRPKVERLSTIHAVAVLTSHVYKLPVGAALGRMTEILQWAARVAAGTAVFRLTRPDNLAGLEDVADLVEEVARAGAHARCFQGPCGSGPEYTSQMAIGPAAHDGEGADVVRGTVAHEEANRQATSRPPQSHPTHSSTRVCVGLSPHPPAAPVTPRRCDLVSSTPSGIRPQCTACTPYKRSRRRS